MRGICQINLAKRARNELSGSVLKAFTFYHANLVVGKADFRSGDFILGMWQLVQFFVLTGQAAAMYAGMSFQQHSTVATHTLAVIRGGFTRQCLVRIMTVRANHTHVAVSQHLLCATLKAGKRTA